MIDPLNSWTSILKATRFSAASLLFAALMAGCGSGTLKSIQPEVSLTGNWSFTASASGNGSPPLILNAGFTQGSSGAVSAVAHLNGAACLNSASAIALSGSVSPSNQIALISQPFQGTTLMLNGTLAPNGKTISNASWSFSGGSCAALGNGGIIAEDYSQINGTYTGIFVDSGNNQLAVSATLTQTIQPDNNGQFQLSGSATFPNNPCFTKPIVTNSLVTGSSLSTTYTQGSASITAVGTFNSDATQLTITNWQVSGGLCDGDSGTGSLTQ